MNYKRPQTNWVFVVRFPFVDLSYNSYKMLFISFYKVVVTLQVDILNI
jgi:hypothetical protein